jgi:general stress protein YciG
VTTEVKRGFSTMSPERQKQIASQGGKAAHAKGTAHKWNKDTAARAGQKGGHTVARDRAHMAHIGRIGAQVRNLNRRQPVITDGDTGGVDDQLIDNKNEFPVP